MLEVLVYFFYLVVIILVLGTAAWASFSAAPWLPTRNKDIERMLKLAELKPGEKLFDLGSGDGRIVLAAARDFKAESFGIELSIFPFLLSKLRLMFAPKELKRRAKIVYGDFFRYDLKEADVVICFLSERAMAKLEPKFKKELKKGARIVSYTFSIKNWPATEIDKPSPKTISVYLYKV